MTVSFQFTDPMLLTRVFGGIDTVQTGYLGCHMRNEQNGGSEWKVSI
jgi:hypothetical protein